jgi:hypothetical protein
LKKKRKNTEIIFYKSAKYFIHMTAKYKTQNFTFLKTTKILCFNSQQVASMSLSVCQITNKDKWGKRGVYLVKNKLFTERNVLKHEWKNTVS